MASRQTFTVLNRGNRDLFVTINDLNESGSPTVWVGERLNEGAAADVQLTVDGSREARVTWRAMRSDGVGEPEISSDMRVDEGDVIEVYVR